MKERGAQGEGGDGWKEQFNENVSLQAYLGKEECGSFVNITRGGSGGKDQGRGSGHSLDLPRFKEISSCEKIRGRFV